MNRDDFHATLESLVILATQAMVFPEELDPTNPDSTVEITTLADIVETLGTLLTASREIQQRTSTCSPEPNRFNTVPLVTLERDRREAYGHIHALVETFQGPHRVAN